MYIEETVRINYILSNLFRRTKLLAILTLRDIHFWEESRDNFLIRQKLSKTSKDQTLRKKSTSFILMISQLPLKELSNILMTSELFQNLTLVTKEKRILIFQ